jgi:hypothetical protein
MIGDLSSLRLAMDNLQGRVDDLDPEGQTEAEALERLDTAIVHLFDVLAGQA